MLKATSPGTRIQVARAAAIACLFVLASSPAPAATVSRCVNVELQRTPSAAAGVVLAQNQRRRLNVRPDALPPRRPGGTSADMRKQSTKSSRERAKEAERAAREDAAARRKRAAEELRGSAGR